MIQAVRKHEGQRPTIAHVVHALGVGGAEVLVDLMVRRFSENYRCVVAVLDEVGEIGEQLRRDGFVVEHMHREPGIDRGCAKRLNQFAEEHSVDLFHAHQYTPFFQAMLSRGLLGSRPVLFTEHGRHFPDLPSRKRAIVNRLLLRKQDRLVGVGEAVRKALIDNEGLPQSRVEVVYNGVDLQGFATPAADARERIRDEFNLAEDDFVCVQVARLHALKDHSTALRTIEIAARKLPQVKLLIVGEGDRRSAIEQEIVDRRLQENVIPTGSRSDVADLLAAADLFLMTSISEGIPLTIIEAMAAELPVVSTAVGGIPEMIQHERNGFLADAEDAESLAKAIVQLASDSTLRSTIGQAGSCTANEQFSLDGMLTGYDRMYQEMIHD